MRGATRRSSRNSTFADECFRARFVRARRERAFKPAIAWRPEHDPEKWIPVFGKDHAQKDGRRLSRTECPPVLTEWKNARPWQDRRTLCRWARLCAAQPLAVLLMAFRLPENR